MIKLSDRLQEIANNICTDSSICDVGTDHGYLGIYLKEINSNRKVILSDVSEPSLQKAKDNANKLGINDIDFRLGNGFDVLSNSEVEVVTIAGMGGLLMSEIINKDLAKSHSFKKFVLQPRNHVGDLRKYLIKNGFDIIKEELVKEGRFICEILTVTNGTSKTKYLNLDKDIMWEIPKEILVCEEKILRDYLHRKLSRERRILFNLYASTNIPKEKVENTKFNIEYIKNLINEI